MNLTSIKKKAQTALFAAALLLLLFAPQGQAQVNAEENSSTKTVQESSKTEQVKNGVLTEKGHIRYYVDGVLQYGLQSVETESGTKTYYFMADGNAFRRGYLEFTNKSGKTCRYYFLSDGTAFTEGFHTVKDRYQADENGNVTTISTGTTYRYYFQKDGKAFNHGFLQFTDSDGNTCRYFFKSDGTAYTTGFHTVTERYTADEDGNITKTSTGTKYIYYFKNDGKAFNQGFLQFTDADGKVHRYYFQQDGTAFTQGYRTVTNRYQADENGNVSKLSNDIKYSYYFKQNGSAFNQGFLQFVHTDGKTYRFYFQSDGTAYKKGLKTVTTRRKADADGNISVLSTGTKYTYYFKSTGNAFNQGFLQFVHTNGKTYRYYFKADGTPFTDGYKSVTVRYQAESDANVKLLSEGTKYKYYFQKNGNAFTGGLLKFTYEGKTYYFYFQSDGTAVTSDYRKVTSLSTVGKDGTISSEEIGTCAYYFSAGANGTKKTSWVKIDGKWYYFNPDTFQQEYQSDAMYNAWQKIKNSSSGSKYYICVDYDACETMIFYGKAGDWIPYKHIICSPGAASTPTVKGHFQVFDRMYSFGTSAYTCYYATRFYGGYLFHSVLYYAGTKTIKDGRLGMHLSHGCVRMAIENAKWIYDNIPNGTSVYVY